MLSRAGLVVNVNQLYLNAQEALGCGIVHYINFQQWVESLGHTLAFKIAYSRQKPEKVKGFYDLLVNKQWEVHFGPQSWNLQMALRAVEILPKIDVLILAGVVPDSFHMLTHARSAGTPCKIVDYHIPQEFRQLAECVFMPKGLVLRDPPNIAKPLELPANVASDGPKAVPPGNP